MHPKVNRSDKVIGRKSDFGFSGSKFIEWMNILLADYSAWDRAVSTSYLFLHCKLEGTELLNRVLVKY
jgi:hypothetical protein